MGITITPDDLKLYADFNQDGHVSEVEKQQADADFQALDTSKDGHLDLQDHWDAGHREAVGRLIAAGANAVRHIDPEAPAAVDHAAVFAATANSLATLNTPNDPESLWTKSQALYNYGALLLNKGKATGASDAYGRSLNALLSMPEASRPSDWQDWVYATSAMGYRAMEVDLSGQWRTEFDPSVLPRLAAVLEQLEEHLQLPFVAEQLAEHTTLDEVQMMMRDVKRLQQQY